MYHGEDVEYPISRWMGTQDVVYILTSARPPSPWLYCWGTSGLKYLALSTFDIRQMAINRLR